MVIVNVMLIYKQSCLVVKKDTIKVTCEKFSWIKRQLAEKTAKLCQSIFTRPSNLSMFSEVAAS